VIRVQGVADPICGAVGHPRRADLAQRLTGDRGRVVARPVMRRRRKERRRWGADRWGRGDRERERLGLLGSGRRGEAAGPSAGKGRSGPSEGGKTENGPC
jgi:hypothetical protein